MDQLLHWLDRSGALALPHAWIWASIAALLALGSLTGIAALARRYDAADATELRHTP